MLRTAMLLALIVPNAWAGFSLDETGSDPSQAVPSEKNTVQEMAHSTPLIQPINVEKHPSAKLVRMPLTFPVTPVPQTWEIYGNDRNLREAFARWAVAAGWQLSWEVEKDIQTAPARFSGSFEDALLEVVKAMQGTEKPISMCVYDNNVVRIVSSSLVCKRSQN